MNIRLGYTVPNTLAYYVKELITDKKFYGESSVECQKGIRNVEEEKIFLIKKIVSGTMS